MIYSIRIFSSFVLAPYFLSGCSDNSSSFSAKEPSRVVIKNSADQVSILEPQILEQTEVPIPAGPEDLESMNQTFPVTKNAAQVDIVWIIDNSGSMNDEVTQIKENFTSFLTSLIDTVNVKLHLLSGDCSQSFISGQTTCPGQPYITLGDEAKAAGHSQQSFGVASNNPLAVFGHAICEVGDPNLECQKAKDFHTLSPFLTTEAGYLREKLRDDAHKVVVIVTDDDAQNFDSNDTNTLIAAKNLGAVTFFSFQGLATSTCQIAQVGTAYMELSAATGGNTFDICAEDWSKNFEQLTKDINDIVVSSYELEKEATEILSITIDGSVLAVDEYKLTGPTTVEIDAEVLKNAQSIAISYQ